MRRYLFFVFRFIYGFWIKENISSSLCCNQSFYKSVLYIALQRKKRYNNRITSIMIPSIFPLNYRFAATCDG